MDGVGGFGASHRNSVADPVQSPILPSRTATAHRCSVSRGRKLLDSGSSKRNPHEVPSGLRK
jgi:hypothetical protein